MMVQMHIYPHLLPALCVHLVSATRLQRRCRQLARPRKSEFGRAGDCEFSEAVPRCRSPNAVKRWDGSGAAGVAWAQRRLADAAVGQCDCTGTLWSYTQPDIGVPNGARLAIRVSASPLAAVHEHDPPRDTDSGVPWVSVTAARVCCRHGSIAPKPPHIAHTSDALTTACSTRPHLCTRH